MTEATTRAASVTFVNCYLQYFVYTPLQTSFFFRNPESEQQLVVRLRDRLRRDQVGRLERAALRLDLAGRRDSLALDDLDRGTGGRGLPASGRP